MATVIQYPVREEGDALTASDVNAIGSAFSTVLVNSMPTSYVDRYALDEQHLPEQSFSSIFTQGYERTSGRAAIVANKATYCNTLPLTASGGVDNQIFPYTYQTFDSTTTGAGSIAIYGATDIADHLYEGWRVPSFNQTSTSNDAEIDLNAATSFTSANISGVVCRAGVGVAWIDVDAIHIDGLSDQVIYPALPSVAVAIGWVDGSSARHVVERSVRFYSGGACIRGNAGTFTYLTQADLDAGDGECASIFLALATVRPTDIRAAKEGSAPFSTRDGDLDRLVIERYNLSITPLRAGSL